MCGSWPALTFSQSSLADDGFLGELREKRIPSRIDHTVMVGKSGSVQSAIRRTLTFLGLTDTMGIPTPRLRNLVEALDTNEWQATLGGVILEAYKPLLEDLDLEKGTEQQLADAFRARGNVSGNTLTMAVRFFLGALDNAGVERSPYFRAPKRPPAKKHATASHQNGGAEPDGDADDSAAVASDPEVNAETNKSGERWPSQPFLLPTRSQPIVLEAPRDLSLAEWKIIDSFVRGMIELRGQAAPSPADDTVNGD
ncbi:MAG: DUF5343 domain-containing protein [Gemmatimonadetes bacterium]|nr:DUF5343 domain-containing protein [Gemmatimonadota bacterium]